LVNGQLYNPFKSNWKNVLVAILNRLVERRKEMKKSTNFNQGRNPKHRGRNAFVNLAKWAGVPDNDIIKSVTRIELEAIKRAEVSIPPFNHKHCFDFGGVPSLRPVCYGARY